MSNIEGYLNIVKESQAKYARFNEKMGTSNNSLDTYYNNALAEVKATNDEVDRPVGGKSTAEKITEGIAIANAGLSGITAALNVGTTIAGIAKSVGGGNNGSKTPADPLQRLNAATAAYASNATEANLKNLTDGIAIASVERNKINAEITTKEAAVAEKQALLNDETKLAASYDHEIDNYANTIAQNQNIVTAKNEEVQKYTDELAAIDKTKELLAKNATQNAEAQKGAQSAVDQSTKDAIANDQAVKALGTQESEQVAAQAELIGQLGAEEAKTPSLENAVTTAKSNFDAASGAVINAERELNIGRTQAASDKAAGNPTSVDLDALNTAVKNAKTDLKKAEKEKESAEKALKDNKKTIANLESKIKIGDKSLADIKASKADAEKACDAAKLKRDEACNQLRGLVDEGKVIDDSKKAADGNYSETTKANDVTNEQLAEAIAKDKTLVKDKADINELQTKVKLEIQDLENKIGSDEGEGTGLKGTLKAYDAALQSATSVRDSKPVVKGKNTDPAKTDGKKDDSATFDVKAEGDILAVANKFNIPTTAVKQISENKFEIVINGTKKNVDKTGKEIE